MQKILFVCLGNICRSPAAEIVFTKKMRDAELSHAFSCDSAGTHNYHPGKSPEKRMAAVLMKRGYPIMGTARHFQAADFDNFDLILPMDADNLANLEKVIRSGADRAKIKSFTSFCTRHEGITEVPDPYYGGAEGFELVADLIEDGCDGILRDGAMYMELGANTG